MTQGNHRWNGPADDSKTALTEGETLDLTEELLSAWDIEPDPPDTEYGIYEVHSCTWNCPHGGTSERSRGWGKR